MVGEYIDIRLLRDSFKMFSSLEKSTISFPFFSNYLDISLDIFLAQIRHYFLFLSCPPRTLDLLLVQYKGDDTLLVSLSIFLFFTETLSTHLTIKPQTVWGTLFSAGEKKSPHITRSDLLERKKGACTIASGRRLYWSRA